MIQTRSRTKRSLENKEENKEEYRHAKFRRFENPIFCDYSCPCGGGQSCIVSRRSVGDWVHEDNVFRSNNLPLRKNCYCSYSRKQINVMKAFYPKY